VGDAQQQCNKCFRLASLSSKDADEQKRYFGKSIPANHWKYTKCLQIPRNQKDFENKYFVTMKFFVFICKSSIMIVIASWLFPCALLIYTYYMQLFQCNKNSRSVYTVNLFKYLSAHLFS